ncbi:UNVERIFIED_CONTAM: F-box protein PP2-B1 [Sesamum radiatum]|uniref:F-box protein PP2-B1 n=1 Tax=Sesamum radiatum TaxID=300843 RepID=A0AAW2S893_SESRA
MSKNYDNWERLVAAVLLREELRRIALSPSSIGSQSSAFTSPSRDLADGNFSSERFLHMDHQEMTCRPRFFLDKMTGKNCCMVGARDLKILLADSPKNWKWRFDADSRFSEVAELRSVLRLDIQAKIKAQKLQPRTVYAACLVFKIAEEAVGLQSAKAMIRFVNDESVRDAAKRARPVYLQLVKDTKGGNVVGRADGWTEVEMGNFYVGKGMTERWRRDCWSSGDGKLASS